MEFKVSQSGLFNGFMRSVIALICAVLMIPGDLSLVASAVAAPQDQEAPKIPADQLDSLVEFDF